MIKYTDYVFYQESYSGEISLDLFNSLLNKAQFEIKKALNRDLVEEDLSYSVQFVTCQMIDYLSTLNNSSIGSITIDGVSKTTKSNTDIENDKINILNGLPNELTRCL